MSHDAQNERPSLGAADIDDEAIPHAIAATLDQHLASYEEGMADVEIDAAVIDGGRVGLIIGGRRFLLTVEPL